MPRGRRVLAAMEEGSVRHAGVGPQSAVDEGAECNALCLLSFAAWLRDPSVQTRRVLPSRH
jgi:hypothetical protein